MILNKYTGILFKQSKNIQNVDAKCPQNWAIFPTGC